MAWSIFSQGPGAAQSWAVDFLQAIGAPTSPGNVQFVYDWERSEGGGGLNNPLNTGPSPWSTTGNQYGGGASDYPSIGAGIQGTIHVLGEHFPGYSQIVGDLRADNPNAAKQALWSSPWASSHYGYGSNWSNAPLPGGRMGLIGPDSPSPYAQGVGAGAGGGSPLGGLFGPGLAQSQAGYQSQIDALNAQAALYGQSIPYQQGLIQQGLGYQLAQLGLSQQGIAAQEKLASEQYGLAQQQFGLQGQRLDQILAQAENAYGVGLRNLHEATAGAGTYGTGTERQGESDLAHQLAVAQQSHDLSMSQLGLSEKGAENSFAYQWGALGREAAGIPLQQQQAQNRAQQGIAGLGLQGQVSVDQINQAIGQASQGQATALTGILPQLIPLLYGGG